MAETSDLTGPLIRIIRQTGTLCLRLNSGKVKVRGAWMHLCPAGTADIVCFPADRVVWIETKALKGELRAKQEEFSARVLELGHEYYVIRDLDAGYRAVFPQ